VEILSGYCDEVNHGRAEMIASALAGCLPNVIDIYPFALSTAASHPPWRNTMTLV
jgi:hypothetical protein